MGSPSRNVQYHPSPSVRRPAQPPPASQSIFAYTLHCSGKSGMRPSRVDDYRRELPIAGEASCGRPQALGADASRPAAEDDMSMRPPASRRVRTPAIALASPAIVQSGPGSLWILPWRGKRARCVRRRLNRRRERVYHTTWTAQTPPTEPTGIVVLALVHEITRTTSMIRCDTDATSLRSPLQQHTPFLRGVSFRCRRGVNSGCRLTLWAPRGERPRPLPSHHLFQAWPVGHLAGPETQGRQALHDGMVPLPARSGGVERRQHLLDLLIGQRTRQRRKPPVGNRWEGGLELVATESLEAQEPEERPQRRSHGPHRPGREPAAYRRDERHHVGGCEAGRVDRVRAKGGPDEQPDEPGALAQRLGT